METRDKWVLAGGIVGAWVLGHAQGVVQHPSPAVLPKIVVHKIIEHPEKVVTKTHTVYETCPGLLETANEIGGYASVLTRTSGQHVDALTAGGEAIYERNIQTLNSALQKEYQLKADADPAAAGLLQATTQFEQQLRQCESR